MKKIIITAADENYIVLLNQLINSLFQFKEPLSDAIGLLDLGLSSSSLEKLKSKVNHIVQPSWDLKVSQNVTKQKPHLRAFTSRPFLTKYFPGYDLYLWLDADTWVQNKFAIKWLFDAASNGSMGIVPQINQSYAHNDSIHWRTKRLLSYYNQGNSNLYWENTYYNSGVFALKNDALHWGSWAKNFQRGLDNCESMYVCDQTALNYAIWTERLKIHPLPAICNWCCHLALPSINKNTKKFCEPHIPYKEIGIIHLTGNMKDASIKLDVASN